MYEWTSATPVPIGRIADLIRELYRSRPVYSFPVPCVFCEAAPLTKEHIFPQWLNRYLPPGEVQALEQARYGDRAYDVSRQAVGLDFVVRKVCAKCNNGWMSTLEGTSIPVLDPLISNLDLEIISLHDQRQIALWAVKTAMMLDITQDQPVLSKEKLARMRSHKAIPKGTRVWLGACAEIFPLVTGLTIRIDTVNMRDPSALLPVGFYAPMKIGHMCLYAYFPMMGIVIQHPPPYGLAVARIWPRRASGLPWPPPVQSSSGAAFEEFADDLRQSWRVFEPRQAQAYGIKES